MHLIIRDMLLWICVSMVMIDFATAKAKDKCSTITSLSPNCVCSSNQIDVNLRCSYNGTADKINQGDGILQINNLDLSGSNLSSLPLNYLNGVEVANHIDLSDNLFTGIPLAIRDSKQLTKLDISRNNLNQFDFSSIRNVENLRHLDVSSNSISTLNTSSAPINSLHTINLANNNIATVEAKSLVSIPNLKNLNLADNNNLISLNDVEYPVHFAKFNISNTIATGLSACALTKLDDFQMFDLTNTKIPCSCELVSLMDKVTLNSEDVFDNNLLIAAPQWTCLDGNNDVTFVSTFRKNCSTITDICKDDGGEIKVDSHNFGLIDFKVAIVNSKSEEIKLEWGGVNSSDVFGYKVVVRSDEEDVYRSTILHSSVQSHTVMGSEVKRGDFDVCVQVYQHNDSSVTHESCQTVSVTSLTVYIGVMAGAVFLIPFSIMIICIVKHDRRHKRKDQLYFAIDAEESKLCDPKKSQTNGKNQISETSKLSIDNANFTKPDQFIPIIIAGGVTNHKLTSTSEKDNQAFVPDDIESQIINTVSENETNESAKQKATESQQHRGSNRCESIIIDIKSLENIQSTHL